ncbi:ribosomal protein L7/L12 [Microbacterium oxydans]|uniref:ribosomal protein L7/L12 n=1 Tax=Microbacterium oxydans TaxID=82380 RepID=UPI00226B222F|nr:ribosomal protein L7/L12 [Microbacterium oxydans]WAA65770.1 ribosomal protein L7/L12 [Microbacterium oxydans]
MMDAWETIPWLFLGFFLVIGGVVIGGIWIIVVAMRKTRPKLPEPQVFTPTTATSHSAVASSATTTVSGLTGDVIAEIDRLVAADQKIHAIKLYRDRSGVSLKEAKDRIDHWSVSTTAPHLAAVSNATAVHSSITPATPTVSAVRASLPAAVASDIDRLVAAGSNIAAIKALREHTGLGLKESKTLIDGWAPHRS